MRYYIKDHSLSVYSSIHTFGTFRTYISKYIEVLKKRRFERTRFSMRIIIINNNSFFFILNHSIIANINGQINDVLVNYQFI